MAYDEVVANWMVKIEDFNTALTALKDAHNPAVAVLRFQVGPDASAQQLSGTSWNQLDSIAAELTGMGAQLVVLGYTVAP